MGKAGHPNDVLLQGGPMHMHFQSWGCPRLMRHRPHDQTVNLPPHVRLMRQRILRCTFQHSQAAAPCAVDAPSDKPAQSSYSQGVNHTCARHGEQPAQQQQLRSHLAVEMQRNCWISYIFLLGSCSGSCCLLKEKLLLSFKTQQLPEQLPK